MSLVTGLRRATAAAVLALAVVVAVPVGASAHSDLVGADPEAGSTLPTMPDEVALTFNEDVQEQGSSIVVTAGSEVVSQAETFAVDGTVASVQLADSDASGAVQVAYRIVSADGHIVRATYTFGVAGSATPTQSTDNGASPSPVSNQTDGSNGTIIWVIGLGVIGLALIAALIAVAMRGRRGPQA